MPVGGVPQARGVVVPYAQVMQRGGPPGPVPGPVPQAYGVPVQQMPGRGGYVQMQGMPVSVILDASSRMCIYVVFLCLMTWFQK